jgi:hypothetical protein
MQGIGSVVNKLNDVVAMIAEVKSISEALGLKARHSSQAARTALH